ncbi:hypothetical protein HCX42_24035 [Escherichia coli]|nr:hypothetical protein [Escherichia coli]NJQ36370.1 hypothetical protein [Escherichia coli]NJQ50373.1 hypothetical protein [Escherichia coli]
MVMESIIPPCNAGKIPSAMQDSVESLTDLLKKKMKDCGEKTRKGREEELVYGDHPLFFRYLPPACLPEKAGKGGGQLEAQSVVTRHFPGQTADGRQIRALLSKQIKEKEAGERMPTCVGAAREGHSGTSGPDAGLPPAERPAGEKKEKTDHFGTPVALPVPHLVGRISGHSPVPLTRSWTETLAQEAPPSFQVPPEMTEKGEVLVYRFRTWGREASVRIQPQHGGAMVLQPSDVAVEQRLVAHWPAEQERHWYLSSDEQGVRKHYQPNRDDDEEN